MTTPARPAERRPLRPADLAARWGVSDWTIRAMIDRGELRAFRVGRMLRIPLDAVEEIERCGKSTPAACGSGSGGSTAAGPSHGTRTDGADASGSPLLTIETPNGRRLIVIDGSGPHGQAG